MRWRVLPHRGAGTNGGAASNGERGNQQRTGADVYVILDYGAMLPCTIVITGDCTCANVDVAPDGCVPDIGQMIDLAAFADGTRLDLNKVSNVDLVSEHDA